MTGSTSAGTDAKADVPAGGSAPANGSQGDGGNAPGDMVPKTQFLAALKSANDKYAALEGEVQQLRAAVTAKADPPKKAPTRTELQQLVDSHDITQAQADEIWGRQIKDEAKREVVVEMNAQTQINAVAQNVEAELSGYKALVPKVWEPGSEERLRVEAKYNHLLSIGQAPGKATEAAALLATFGDLETLRASMSTRPGPADTHSETGGGQRPSGGGGGDGVKGLSAAQRDYYEAGIKAGRYENWAAVKAELEFKPKSARR